MYLTAYGIHLKGITSLDDLYGLYPGRKNVEFEPLIVDNRNIGLSSVPLFSPEDEFYPSRADIKILRTDTIAAVYAVRRMVKDFGLQPELLERAGLWVTSGAFEDRLLYDNSKLVRYLKKAFEARDQKERLRRTYRAIPPMLGLNTLTNATESFVAQYAGIRGRSTTVGNTSASGYYALSKARQRLEVFGSGLEIAGGSNLADTSFFLTWKNYQPVENPRGFTGAAFLALQSTQGNARALARLENLHHAFDIREFVLPATESNTLIVSNPYGFELSAGRYARILDMYSIAGNGGAVMFFVAVLFALSLLKNEKLKQVDCLDIDLYGRTSFVTVKSML